MAHLVEVLALMIPLFIIGDGIIISDLRLFAKYKSYLYNDPIDKYNQAGIGNNDKISQFLNHTSIPKVKLFTTDKIPDNKQIFHDIDKPSEFSDNNNPSQKLSSRPFFTFFIENHAEKEIMPKANKAASVSIALQGYNNDPTITEKGRIPTYNFSQILLTSTNDYDSTFPSSYQIRWTPLRDMSSNEYFNDLRVSKKRKRIKHKEIPYPEQTMHKHLPVRDRKQNFGFQDKLLYNNLNDKENGIRSEIARAFSHMKYQSLDPELIPSKIKMKVMKSTFKFYENLSNFDGSSINDNFKKGMGLANIERYHWFQLGKPDKNNRISEASIIIGDDKESVNNPIYFSTPRTTKMNHERQNHHYIDYRNRPNDIKSSTKHGKPFQFYFLPNIPKEVNKNGEKSFMIKLSAETQVGKSQEKANALKLIPLRGRNFLRDRRFDFVKGKSGKIKFPIDEVSSYLSLTTPDNNLLRDHRYKLNHPTPSNPKHSGTYLFSVVKPDRGISNRGKSHAINRIKHDKISKKEIGGNEVNIVQGSKDMDEINSDALALMVNYTDQFYDFQNVMETHNKSSKDRMSNSINFDIDPIVKYNALPRLRPADILSKPERRIFPFYKGSFQMDALSDGSSDEPQISRNLLHQGIKRSHKGKHLDEPYYSRNKNNDYRVKKIPKSNKNNKWDKMW
ncbi:unnamed protein product [Gordionus sp. m RMFG-2023]